MSTRENTARLVRCQNRCKALERRLLEAEQCLAAAEAQIGLLEGIAGKWCDKTKLTLDVLRRELGEPVRGKKTKSGARRLWGVFAVDEHGQEVWDWQVEWVSFLGREAVTVNDTDVRTLGQLRRILSVIEETNGEVSNGADQESIA